MFNLCQCKKYRRKILEKYRDNNNVRKYLLLIMENENITYKKLGERIDTSPQNVHKMLHKDQLKLDDVSKICSALGYSFYFDICKDNKNSEDHEDKNGLSKIQIENIKHSLQKIQDNITYMNNVQKEMENKVEQLFDQID